MYNMYNQNNGLYNSYMSQPQQQTPNLQYYYDYQKTLEEQLRQVNHTIGQYQPQQIPVQTPQQIPQPAQQTQQNLAAQQQQQALLELEALIDRSVKANLSQMQNSNNNPTYLKILQAIGNNLSQEDQLWLSSNMEELSEFLKTPEGNDVTHFVIDSYKSYHGIDTTKS